MAEKLPARKPRDFFEASRHALTDEGLGRKLAEASSRHLDKFAAARAEFGNYEAECETCHLIKREAIGSLDELIVDLSAKLEANGARVFFAADAGQARDYIVQVAAEAGVKRAVKGKSMTAEEIGLNHALEAAGVEVVETDLGEFIVQLRDEPPSHILTPAIHLSKEEIGDLFGRKLETEYSAEPEVLTAQARDHLRSVFLAADLGIVGVNFAIAETGTLVLVENEGNGRMATTMPETLVAIMGIEKVIPRLADLSHFLEVLARTATGQKITTYTNFINGPRREDELDGPREVHVVILDNGRSTMLADPVMREALYCIRCGACLNVCPVYRRIGGHAYRSVYPGPVGSIVSPSLVGGDSGVLPFASTLCGACKEICPVRIDIPRLLLHLRWKQSEGGRPLRWRGVARWARRGARTYAAMARRPWMIRILGKIAATSSRPVSRGGYLRRLPPPFSSWTRFRDFPSPGGAGRSDHGQSGKSNDG